jgi:hypothetical protein
VTLLELEELSEAAAMKVGGVMVFDALTEGGVPSVEETDRGATLERVECRSTALDRGRPERGWEIAPQADSGHLFVRTKCVHQG